MNAGLHEALLECELADLLLKAGMGRGARYPVGAIRRWAGRTYKKISEKPARWVPVAVGNRAASAGSARAQHVRQGSGTAAQRTAVKRPAAEPSGGKPSLAAASKKPAEPKPAKTTASAPAAGKTEATGSAIDAFSRTKAALESGDPKAHAVAGKAHVAAAGQIAEAAKQARSGGDPKRAKLYNYMAMAHNDMAEMHADVGKPKPGARPPEEQLQILHNGIKQYVEHLKGQVQADPKAGTMLADKVPEKGKTRVDRPQRASGAPPADAAQPSPATPTQAKTAAHQAKQLASKIAQTSPAQKETASKLATVVSTLARQASRDKTTAGGHGDRSGKHAARAAIAVLRIMQDAARIGVAPKKLTTGAGPAEQALTSPVEEAAAAAREHGKEKETKKERQASDNERAARADQRERQQQGAAHAKERKQQEKEVVAVGRAEGRAQKDKERAAGKKAKAQERSQREAGRAEGRAQKDKERAASKEQRQKKQEAREAQKQGAGERKVERLYVKDKAKNEKARVREQAAAKKQEASEKRADRLYLKDKERNAKTKERKRTAQQREDAKNRRYERQYNKVQVQEDAAEARQAAGERKVERLYEKDVKRKQALADRNIDRTGREAVRLYVHADKQAKQAELKTSREGVKRDVAAGKKLQQLGPAPERRAGESASGHAKRVHAHWATGVAVQEHAVKQAKTPEGRKAAERQLAVANKNLDRSGRKAARARESSAGELSPAKEAAPAGDRSKVLREEFLARREGRKQARGAAAPRAGEDRSKEFKERAESRRAAPAQEKPQEAAKQSRSEGPKTRAADRNAPRRRFQDEIGSRASRRGWPQRRAGRKSLELLTESAELLAKGHPESSALLLGVAKSGLL